MPCIGVIIDTHLLVTVSTLATEEDLLQLRKACSTLSLAARCSSLTPALLQHSTRWTLPEQQCQLTQTLLLLLQAGEAAARGCAGLRVRRCRRRSGSVSRSCCAAPSAAPARPASTPMAAPRCRRQRRALARRAPHRRRLSCVTRSLGVAPGRGFLHPCFRDSAGAGQLARCLLPASATLATHGQVLRGLLKELLDCGIAHVWFALSSPNSNGISRFVTVGLWLCPAIQRAKPKHGLSVHKYLNVHNIRRSRHICRAAHAKGITDSRMPSPASPLGRPALQVGSGRHSLI